LDSVSSLSGNSFYETTGCVCVQAALQESDNALIAIDLACGRISLDKIRLKAVCLFINNSRLFQEDRIAQSLTLAWV
jgi:hypothetical protein